MLSVFGYHHRMGNGECFFVSQVIQLTFSRFSQQTLINQSQLQTKRSSIVPLLFVPLSGDALLLEREAGQEANFKDIFATTPPSKMYQINKRQ